MSRLYKQMEEDVAQRVRETMQLADSRRKARSPTHDKFQRAEDAPQRPPRKSRAVEFELGDGSIDSSVRAIESTTEAKNDISVDVLKTGKDTTAKRVFLAKDIPNVAKDTMKNLSIESSAPQFHIGFEHVRDNVDKKPISNTKQTTEATIASNLSDNDRDLALGALTLAQTAANNIDNRLYTVDESDKRQLAQGALNLAQGAVGNIADGRHETNYTDQRHLAVADKRNVAEGALILAQMAAWNIDNKFGDEADERPQGELKVALAEGDLSLAQNPNNITNQTDKHEGELNLALAERALNLAKNAATNINHRRDANEDKGELGDGPHNAAWNIDHRVYKTKAEAEGWSSFESMIGPKSQENQKLQLGFDHLAASYNQLREDKKLGEVINEVNKRSLAEYDKKTEAKIRQLSVDLQNLEMDIDNNNYDMMTEVDESKKELAEGALNLAQMGARYIGAGDTKIRELGEGALGLAQAAAKERLSKEGAETSLEDAFFKSLTNQMLQLGFEQIEHSSDGDLQETEQADSPHHSRGSKRHSLETDLVDSKTHK